MLAAAIRRHLTEVGLCRYEAVGPAGEPICFLEELPTALTSRDAIGVFVSPGPIAPSASDQFEVVTVRVIVRMDHGNSYASNTAGLARAEAIRNALHGLGDGFPVTIGAGDTAAVVSNVLARDTAPIALGPESGSTVPRWSVVFYVDRANTSPERVALGN